MSHIACIPHVLLKSEFQVNKAQSTETPCCLELPLMPVKSYCIISIMAQWHKYYTIYQKWAEMCTTFVSLTWPYYAKYCLSGASENNKNIKKGNCGGDSCPSTTQACAIELSWGTSICLLFFPHFVLNGFVTWFFFYILPHLLCYAH